MITTPAQRVWFVLTMMWVLVWLLMPEQHPQDCLPIRLPPSMLAWLALLLPTVVGTVVGLICMIIEWMNGETT